MRTNLREVSPRWTRPLLSWAGATFLTVAVTVNALPVPFGVGLGYVHPGPALVALVITLLVPVLWRAPLVALALLLAGAATVATVLGDLRVGFEPMFPAYVALCYIAASRGRRTSVAALCLAVAVPAGQGVVLIARAGAVPTAWWSQTPVLYAAVFAWLVGHTIHRSRQFAASARAQAADRAMTAERLRIARELHDMVAHSVGVIAIQAGMGSRVIRTQPDEAEQALRTIETTSREALTGLRRTLLALRQADPSAHDGPGAPGLADVDRLAAAATDTGLTVEVRRDGVPAPLPADVDLAAYRIVQEALTNVIRHADARRCDVTIRHRHTELSVEVVDDGRGTAKPPGAPGFGLVGMRERAGLLDGRFEAGHRPGGGYRVAVTLPLPTPAPSADPLPS